MISLASALVGTELPARKFHGGAEANNFLIARRFQVVDKAGNTVGVAPVDEDDASAFPEGRAIYAIHRRIERNPALIAHVKQRRLNEAGDLLCDCCGFSFSKAYGSLGLGFIEAHHTRFVSTFEGEGLTDPAEIALVCSNCHRMLHRERPWLAIHELRKILHPNQRAV